MSPIPFFSRSSRTPSGRNRYPLLLDNGRLNPTDWQLEDFATEGARSSTSLWQSLPQQSRPDRYQPEQFVPRQFFREKRRGGGGSSSSGGSRASSSSSSGGYIAPAPAAAPAPQSKSSGSGSPSGGSLRVAPKPASKPAAKIPAPAPPVKKPAPPAQKPNPQPPASQPAPTSGITPAKSPKPKPAAVSSGMKPNADIPANTPDGLHTPGVKPPKKPPTVPPPFPHTPMGHNAGATNHNHSNHLNGCKATCRAAVIGTFGAIALLGLLCLLVFCIIRRRRIHRTRAIVRTIRSKSRAQARSSTGREWWKQGRQKSSVSEDGWELTASENYMASGVPFSMSHASLDWQPTSTSVRRATSPITDEETPMTPMHSRERHIRPSAVQAARSIRSGRSTHSCPAIIMARRGGSPCSSCLHGDPHSHSQISHTRASGVRSPLSVESDESSWDDPILGTAQRATVFQHPQPIQTIAGMQSFRARHCPLQRRGARRKFDRPDMSGSRHQSESSRTSTTGDESTDDDSCSATHEEEACNATDDEGTRTVTEDGGCERGRTSHRISHGSARGRREQRLHLGAC